MIRRRRPRLAAGFLALGFVLTACGTRAPRVPVTSSPTPTVTATASPSVSPTTSPAARPTLLASTPSACVVAHQSPPPGTIGADFATALAFAPDGRLFYAERSGTVRVWQDGASHTFATVQTVVTEPGGGYSERGLLGIAVSPTFDRDRFVYAFYSDADYTHQHVIRWRDCAGRGEDAKIIVTVPSGSDCCHKGGRIAFAPDGSLYVTLGDEHSAPVAQDTGDVRGKLLRYRSDGTVPPDDPFGPGDPVWAYGFRNPFGLAVSASGQVAVTVNGPTGDAGSPSTGYDTVIADVRRGKGYEWPNCYGYGHPLAAGSCGSGQSDPDWSSERSTVVPTGATFVDARGPSGYAGHLVFCTFNDGMRILTPGTPHATVQAGPAQCRLDVKQGPDHALYYSDTAHIYKLG